MIGGCCPAEKLTDKFDVPAALRGNCPNSVALSTPSVQNNQSGGTNPCDDMRTLDKDVKLKDLALSNTTTPRIRVSHTLFLSS